MNDQGTAIPSPRARTAATDTTPPTPKEFEAALQQLGFTIGPRNFVFSSGSKSWYATSSDYVLFLAAKPEYATASVTKSTDTAGTHYFFELTNTIYQVDLQGFTGANVMGLEASIRAWFDAHQGVREALKHGVVWCLGYAAANIAYIVGYLPSWAPPFVGVAVAAGIGWLAQVVNEHVPWPIIGARLQ